ncbi:MAG: anaerobic ribonucleoside-triphosphate reductase activating protein [Massilibacteroides sp.]|nr:anaerobic ribonucleoside-triphosphate reductase activating protein [Massilibacteroides sp.]MDD3061792.1 anaerobic ribonucleoside-triphosphate reductase activating protein [Massilibacteroides sp.]MDD4115093.1 anaerobic ribonucleoside-triphosphate reductase activating protein [Massilibacteroides sp.]MDD4660074.1 anaerobic ribonucleoside-triphosphate reductase activating protein [Massilibacteroides sp.]
MLRYVNYDIVFQEVPGEVTLSINLSNCPNHCKGCHSPYLWENIGEILDEHALVQLLERYGQSITCICFMGGDANPHEVEASSVFVREQTNGRIKTAWYSGKNKLPETCSPQNFDYIKLGPYMEKLGGLDSATTNQHFYRVDQGKMTDITYVFLRSNRKFPG